MSFTSSKVITQRTCRVIALVIVWLIRCEVHQVYAAPPKVQYNRDVRPVLSDKCFHCHGPDAATRQAELRLDQRQSATLDRDGHRVVHAGQSAMSELIRRVVSTDDNERMPPPGSGDALSYGAIEIIRQWIDEGAEYQKHWSFIPPQRPELPSVIENNWPKNGIDRFVLARLERDGRKPSARASTEMLIRRVTLDLTGLPPTLDEIDAFQEQSRQDADSAYADLVDRLLKSPRFGEHMAVRWLDAARYADTNGYFTDNDRTMWPWRDWVINAFNSNMPFDQFTIEQLAGDLLPDPTINQKIATGFNRNHMVNNETGIIEEEFRVEYVVDRVDTTSTVWMGLTLGCARCHDHKYDPISQKDFYRFFAFFNNVPERGLSGSSGNAAPILKVPDDQLQAELDRVRHEVMDAEEELAAVQKELASTQSEWERTAGAELSAPSTDGLVAHFNLDDEYDQSMTTGAVSSVQGILGDAAKFDGGECINIPSAIDMDRDDAFSFGAWIQPASAGCVISKMDDADEMRGLDITLRKGKAIVNLVHAWNRDAIRVATAASIPTRQWQHLFATYDGSGRAAGVAIYLNGEKQSVEIIHDTLTGSIRNTEPIRIGRRQASASYKGLVDDVRVYYRELSSEEVALLADTQLIRGVLSMPSAQRSESLKRRLQAWFVEHRADKNITSITTRVAALRKRAGALTKALPTTMIMQDMKEQRPAFVLERGEYDQHGEKVDAGVPEFLTSETLKEHRPAVVKNRLEMAQWLVNPKHPLTARVTVNRFWQQLFGTGIVKSVDDFGTQGDWPSHPELLDWLAVELVECGWDIKHIIRLMVTSSTYCQTSNAPAKDYRSDPENRLLARGPRFRMDAEMLRDNALAISGLLVEKIGGPTVRPYQPEGLWKEVTYDSDSEYQQGTGESLYRRSLYSFWKRQSPPPNMLVFDAPTRETCTVQRSRTNTPLQALVLMNDPTFVEAARKLAEQMMTLPVDGELRPIPFAFRSATARFPIAFEVRVLNDVFLAQKQSWSKRPADAAKLLSVGESRPDESLDRIELAAWTTVASMILCLDESITRQ